MGADRAVRYALILAAIGVVLWVRTLPLQRTEPQLQYQAGDGREHVYLADYDSYLWLRNARNYLRTGTTCDAVVDGACRDTYGNAPVGSRMVYNRSLHIVAIVTVHRLLTWFNPDYPLPASSFLVPVIVGVLGVIPAFTIGWRLAGTIGGLWAAVLIGINPTFLQRSMGSDNDVWNVVLPLFMMWAAIEALHASSTARRVTWAVGAATVAALHATTWSGWVFTYDVLLVGLLANAVMRALRAALRHSWRVWRCPDTGAAALVLVTFYFATGVLTTLMGTQEQYWQLPLAMVRAVVPASPSPSTAAALPTANWPDLFATVSELLHPNLSHIAKSMTGILVFFVGWLGLLVLVLPRRRWRWWHFVILIVGNYLYRYLVTAPNIGRTALVGFLAAPLAVAIFLYVVADDEQADAQQGAGVTVVVWFLGALVLSYGGLRFIMLLVPPFALACAVGVGRLHQWLQERTARLDARLRGPARAALLAGFAALLILPGQRGAATARSFTPGIDDAWWQTLTAIRDTAPPDAIVNTWWDYGYWVKYVAERRVSADGGALQTHIAYWIGRALFAGDERESLGLLRMLNCGSDATPQPEGSQGAYGKLVAHGVDEIAAPEAVTELARRDRAQARLYLTTLRLSDEAQDDVLASTHCAPPPTYLLLTSDLIAVPAWHYVATWDFRKAYIAKQLRFRPEAEAVSQLISRLGYSENDARAAIRQAKQLRSDADVHTFVASPVQYLTRQWVPCVATGPTFTCHVSARIDRRGTVLDTVIIPSDLALQTRLRFHQAATASRASRRFSGAPGAVLLAGETGIESVSMAAPTHPNLGILYDTVNRRVLVAPPSLLQSTFTQLMFLDGRYAHSFEKLDEQVGFRKERVVTWKVNWEGRGDRPSP